MKLLAPQALIRMEITEMDQQDQDFVDSVLDEHFVGKVEMNWHADLRAVVLTFASAETFASFVRHLPVRIKGW